jgi:hypothetical protein
MPVLLTVVADLIVCARSWSTDDLCRRASALGDGTVVSEWPALLALTRWTISVTRRSMWPRNAMMLLSVTPDDSRRSVDVSSAGITCRRAATVTL